MAYDPNYPADHSEIKAAEFRNQFNALKALYDSQQAQIAELQAQLAQKPSMADVNTAIAANSANNVDGIDLPEGQISDPPQQTEVQGLQDCVTGLMVRLQH